MPVTVQKKSSDPRYLSAQVLLKIEEKKILLDQVLDDFSEVRQTLSAKDNALFNALIYGVLRSRSKLDHILDHYLNNTSFSSLSLTIQTILRVGLYQVAYMDRIPSSAAVNTSVELAKKLNESHATGFINAVLRKITREGIQVPLPTSSSPEYIAITASFPLWLINRWKERYGLEETRSLCDKMNEIPPITIRVNSMRTTRTDLIQKLSRHARNLEPTQYSPLGIRIFHLESPIETWPEYKKGLFQVQDEAAQLIGYFFDPKKNETILDACAGLGGKTGHMALIVQNEATIIAADIYPNKLQQLSAEMKRLQAMCVTPKEMDFSKPLSTTYNNYFDRIFLDAPCSGLGVIRRNPDTKWAFDKKDLKTFQRQQVQFLEHIAPTLKPNGILLYAVCSMEAAENEKVVQTFLKKQPDFDIIFDKNMLPNFLEPFIDENGFLRTYPHQHDMDGFFAVKFTKHPA